MITLPVELFIAIRYIKARKKGSFSLLTTFISVGGIALGVAALVITLAVMSGFQNDVRDKILGIQPHIVLTRIDRESFKNYVSIEDKIKNNEHVVSVSPFIYRQGIVRGMDEVSQTGIVIKAIDYEKEDKVLNFSKQITVSDIKFDNKKIGERSIIIGSELAKNISVSAGDKIILMFPENFGTIPKMYKFNISALIESGMYDFDSTVGFIDLKEGQTLFSMQDEVTGLDIHTDNFDKVSMTAEQLQKGVSYFYMTRTWIEMNKNLFSAIKLEKIMMFLVLGLIVIVAAFNIISNLLLSSVKKSKEIGIMSAMGFSRFSISKLFFFEGLIVGLIGTILGIISGLCVSFSLKYFNIFKLPKGMYYVDKLSVAIIPSDILIVAVSAFMITVIAATYPAYQISKLNPLEVMRCG
ncbi:MAG: ABC transporter permease [Endomicrobium sp.]|jgi:lipoprotein-releasing system permease protein|nr:ABC transporter permease [Endomicrobium sp.]